MKEIDRGAIDRKTIPTFGRAALFLLAVVLLLAAFGWLAGAHAHGDDAHPRGELTGESRPWRESPEAVLVHDDFDWISRGKYRSSSGELCCGKDDCYEVAPARVLQSRQGYELLDHAHQDGSPITVPYKLAIPSEDGKYWICKVGSRMRCFFAPLTGS